MKKTINIIINHHIVGVHTLFLCKRKNSVAFHIVACCLICFPSLNSFNNSIKVGIMKKPIRKVARPKEKIKIKCEFISVLYLKYYNA
jgi:hypothetical protein